MGSLYSRHGRQKQNDMPTIPAANSRKGTRQSVSSIRMPTSERPTMPVKAQDIRSSPSHEHESSTEDDHLHKPGGLG